MSPRRSALALLLVLAGIVAGCAATSRPTAQLRATPVDCLPGRADGAASAASTRRSAFDCAAAGGSYTAADPVADLNLWLALAQDGQPVAQTRVGQLYERGVAGVAPDHATAATWYRRAARQQYAPAMLRLAVLTEQGLGVRRDPDQARDLMRRASRGPEALVPPPRLVLVEPSVVLSGLDAAVPARVEPDRPDGRLALLGRVGAWGERPRSVLVDGQAVRTDSEGYFRAEVTLRRGGAPVQLQVTDSGGRTTRAALMAATAAEASARSAAVDMPAPGRHALLIANQDYRAYEKLDTPVNDARDLKQLLERRYGFRATLLQNATRREVLQALAALRQRLSAADELIVFYAGHGEVDAVTQRAYWVPVDGRRGDSSTWLSTVDVSDQLQAIAARRVLLIVDSCYAGAVNQRALRAGDADIAAASLQLDAAPPGADKRTRVALSSGGLEPVIDGAGGRNSLYAAALLDVLGAATAPLTGDQLHGETAARFQWRALALKVAQRPHFGPVRLAGHEAGDITLVPLPR